MNNTFEDLFSHKAIRRGRTDLYHYYEAKQLVECCEKNNVSVLGIDAFLLSDKCTRPVMEHSIDLSDKEESKRNALAFEFLESKKNLDLFFEIVY
ncbi:MAG: hypothetical protein J6J21_00105 [Clostridia bacterium]|nr:hypothetical protein [Clostridia bacterium]